jgi:hypothetical protein
LRKHIPESERCGLLKDISLAPAWMRPFFLELAREEPASALQGTTPEPPRKVADRA